MKDIIASALPFLIGAAIFLAFFAYFMAERFFSLLVRVQPDALDTFQRGPGLPQYGPIAPSKFRYLNSRQFIFLRDPDLRRKGAQAYLALVGYAVSFVVLLLCALAWGL
jgi:hypothetical protein